SDLSSLEQARFTLPTTPSFTSLRWPSPTHPTSKEVSVATPPPPPRELTATSASVGHTPSMSNATAVAPWAFFNAALHAQTATPRALLSHAPSTWKPAAPSALHALNMGSRQSVSIAIVLTVYAAYS